MDSADGHENPGIELAPVPGTRILRMTRNERPFANVQAMVGVLDAIQAELSAIDRSRHALLMDTRKVQGRTDPDFEKAFRHFRSHVTSGFARVAVLVASAEGLAQARAHSEQTGPHVQAFDDEGAALAWLREVAEGP